MFTKAIIIITMFIIIISLGSAVIFLIRDDGKSNRTVKALTWRIGLSLGLFIFLLLGFTFGFLSPHPV